MPDVNAHLCAGNDTLALDADDAFRRQRTRQVRIRREALPIAATQRYAPGRPDDGAQQDVDALFLELVGHGGASAGRQFLVPAVDLELAPVLSIGVNRTTRL
jgi:hypothetical protein